MNYRKIRLQPIRIYEAFELQMKRGDVISRYIVERMEKKEVIKLIEGVHIPATTRDAVNEGHRYGDKGRYWFQAARFIKLRILPCVMVAFFIVFFLALLTLVSTSLTEGVRVMLWCGVLFAFYMVCYTMGQGFFQIATKYVIRAATITANLEYSGEVG